MGEMGGVAGGALGNQRRSMLSDATAELQRHQRQSHEHLQEQSNATCQKFNKKSKSSRLRVEKLLKF